MVLTNLLEGSLYSW